MEPDEQGDPVAQALAKIRAKQGASADPVADALAKIRQPDPNAALHAEFKRGDLAKRIANENAETMAEDAPDLMTKILGTVASGLRHVPFGETVQAGASALVNRIPYRDALKSIKQAEDASGLAGDVAGMVGGGLAMAAMPGSGLAEQAARTGFLNAVGQSDPDKDVRRRVGEGIVQSAIQGSIGKAGEYLGTANRAINTPEPAALRVVLKGERNAAAAPGYDAFRKMGDLEPVTGTQGPLPIGPLRQSEILDLPVVRTAINQVKGESPILKNLPDTDARLLDAVYKRVGKKAFAAQHGYETNEARQALLNEIENVANAQGGSFAAPVKAFREGSLKMEAVRKGARLLRNTVKGTPESQEETYSPAALSEWLKTAGADEVANANQGIAARLGTKQVPIFARIPFTRVPVPGVPSEGLQAAIALLEQTGTPPTLANLLKNFRGAQ